MSDNKSDGVGTKEYVAWLLYCDTKASHASDKDAKLDLYAECLKAASGKRIPSCDEDSQ